MAINLDKQAKTAPKKGVLRNKWFWITIVIIAVVLIAIGLIWGDFGYAYMLKVFALLFGIVAVICFFSNGDGCIVGIVAAVLAIICTCSSNGIANSHSLSTGAVPYKNYPLNGYRESAIIVKTSQYSKKDLVVIVKQNNHIVGNAYITPGGNYTFEVPNGTYQVFFYQGRGWKDNKEVSEGIIGGFVNDEEFRKDNPVTLSSQSVTYDLTYSRNGNLRTQQTDESDMFK